MKPSELIIGAIYRINGENFIYCGKEKSDFMHGPTDFIFKTEQGKVVHTTSESIYFINKN